MDLSHFAREAEELFIRLVIFFLAEIGIIKTEEGKYSLDFLNAEAEYMKIFRGKFLSWLTEESLDGIDLLEVVLS